MKVAVYSIAKNEEKHIKRWAESAADADVLLIADTGSTDKTVEIAESLGIIVHRISVDPFRFDDARNASLALIPADIDYCIALDLDEVLEPGWRWELEKCFKAGVNRPHYRFITKVNPDGSVAQEFDGFRIHSRKNVRWKFPIHEVPMNYGEEEKRGKSRITIKHLPDESKSRGQYLPMLEMAVLDDPSNARHKYYLAREYYYHEKWEEAADFFKLYIDQSEFPAEKSSAYRMLAKCEPEKEEEYFLLAISEREGRESFLALADYYHRQKRWEECLAVAMRSLEYTEKDTTFISEEWAWTHTPYDLIAVAAWNLGSFEMAAEYGKKAVEISPNDERLQKNLKFYQEKIDGNT
jgi:glycosyltransferase involved in cell wall biosynthesis